MRCNYKQNKLTAAYINSEPTMTDQAGADATNINVIIKQFRVSGRVLGHDQQHIDADFALLPSDLRTMIEMTREIGRMREQLPRELRDKHPDELMSMTTEQLVAILKPPAPTPAPEQKETPK